jgi:hypothetical protein
MKVYATQCPFTKVGNQLVPKFKLGPQDIMGAALRQKYGDLIWVLEPNAAPWTPGVFDTMKSRLKDYDGSEDHLLLLGNPVLMSMMAVYAADVSDKVRFLQWSNGDYLPLEVEL